jgi:hypothetical protein
MSDVTGPFDPSMALDPRSLPPPAVASRSPVVKRSAALTVTCPECQKPPGDWCRPSGRHSTRNVHGSRLALVVCEAVGPFNPERAARVS